MIFFFLMSSTKPKQFESLFLKLCLFYRRTLWDLQLNCYFQSLFKWWKEEVLTQRWEGVDRGGTVWWRAGGPGAAVPAVTRRWSFTPPFGPVEDRWSTFNTSRTACWTTERRHVGPRIAEQCVFMFAEPKNYFQEKTKAVQEPGPSVDATLWYRGRRDTVGGQWPSCDDCQNLLLGMSENIRKPESTKHVQVYLLIFDM